MSHANQSNDVGIVTKTVATANEAFGATIGWRASRYGSEVEALIDEWLRGIGEEDRISIRDDASLTLVRERIRELQTGAGVELIERSCLVATEIGQNQLRHANGGVVVVRAIARGAHHHGIEVIGVDRGQGIRDVCAALDGLPRALGTLGVGVDTIRRRSSEVDFDVRLGEGTRIIARILDPEAPRHREVGIYGSAIEGESVSGDHASFWRSHTTNNNNTEMDSLTIGIFDGLGHGPAAHEAAQLAAAVFDQRVQQSGPAEIIEACHIALTSTRGAVMTVAKIDSETLEVSTVGNIDVQLIGPRVTRRFGGSSAIVGGRGNVLPKPFVETAEIADANELVVLTTDGIQSRMSIEQDLTLLREHPIAIAQRIVELWSRAQDDVLVVVAR